LPRPEPGQRYWILWWSPVLHFLSIPLGESPPPAPRDCFGRDELIEKVVGLVENLEPVALIGAGGIGKTSIALTVLHHKRIEDRFGDNRRFIRCDQFPASCTHFLARLSRVIGAGVENPEDLTLLRPFLSSKEMLITLDNAESVLDPQGANAREIYSVVDELCQFKTICVLITSRVTTVPRHCKRPEIPTLSMEAACDIFHGIYGDDGRSNIIDDLLQQLDFHALSITLLATTASYNRWDYDRLAKKWNTQRAQVLQTDYNESLAATIELSLTSPTFCKLGPDARDLLGVIAFFPQGVDENNLDWLFPTIPNRENIIDKFCVLSLTHRSNGFVTMLAPIRDYLSPKDPRSSPLLCAARDHYISRLSVAIRVGMPGFEETKWIVSEDINVEHLLDVFTTTDPSRRDIWEACRRFMDHLHWHKPRQTMLGSKVEALPDDHYSKPKCLRQLSMILGKLGNFTEQKRLLAHTLELVRRRGDDDQVAFTLRQLSDVNGKLGFHEEGIQQVKEALDIFERTGNTRWKMHCSNGLARLLFHDNQLEAAEDVASRTIDLATEKGQEIFICRLHQVLGSIYSSRGERRRAIHHFETAIGIATPFNWHDELFWYHLDLAVMFRDGGDFDEATTHSKRAKLHAVDEAYKLGRAMGMQADVWYQQLRLEGAKSEALQALEIFEKLGAAKDAEDCKGFLREVEQAMEK
jgi:tetratricopeptide (TPR) repeat protein